MVGRNVLEHHAAMRYEMISLERGDLDLLDKQAVTHFMRDVRPDAVVHAAGKVGGIQSNMREMARFLLENTNMGCNVIMGAFDASVQNFINLGSSCMYPRNCEDLLRESMLLTGQLEPTNEGYAIAKNLTARLCHYLNRENPGLRYRTLIPCNLYGRWDHYDDLERSHLMAAIITKVERAMRNREAEITIWGTGEVRREFLYASDLADCIYWSLENIDKLPDVVNCGTGVDHTVTEYYHLVASAAGYCGRFVYDRRKPDGMRRKLMDISKLVNLGWSSKTDIRSGIAKAISFYRTYSASTITANA